MKKRNPMMDRPIIDQDILDYMRTKQRAFEAPIHALEQDANARRVPVIPHETAVFLDTLLAGLQPKRILEIGTAIGFSASLMAFGHGERHIDTIDRFDIMIEEALGHFEMLHVQDQIHLLRGDAEDILPTLQEPYDFIFMDSAKAKYYDFFPICMSLLRVGGMLLIDDIFQGGTILAKETEIPRRARGIHRKLNQLLDTVLTHPDFKASLLPLGDGILLVTKTKAEIDFSAWDES